MLNYVYDKQLLFAIFKIFFIFQYFEAPLRPVPASQGPRSLLWKPLSSWNIYRNKLGHTEVLDYYS